MPKKRPNKKPKKKPSKITLDFAKRLEACRVSVGIESGKKFAELLKIKPHTYRRYARAETEPSLKMLIEISSALRKSIDFLILGDEGVIRSDDFKRLRDQAPPERAEN